MSEADPTEAVTVSAAAASQPGSELGLVAGERVQVRDLLYALLLQSSNDAAIALAEHVGGTVDGFLDLMAARGRMLGLSDTRFTSPSGLDDRGYSTARDLATMTRAAYAQPLFEKIVKTRFHDIPAPSGPPRRIQNRNVLLWLYPGAIGVKTGFTTPAGHCLVAAVDHEGLRLLGIALGAGGPDAGDVFNDGAALLNYGYSAFQDEVLIHAGDPVGPFRVGGADVRAVAAASLVRLVRRDLLNTVGIIVRMDTDLAIPIAAGQRIGSVAATVDGRPAGEVDVVAAATVTGPRPPPPSPPVDAGAGRDGGWTRLVHALVALTLAIVEPFL
jgi:serine-type D-Ala-D-Ala carboxypeptidase (penicillin-binding protein 5/6)